MDSTITKAQVIESAMKSCVLSIISRNGIQILLLRRNFIMALLNSLFIIL